MSAFRYDWSFPALISSFSKWRGAVHAVTNRQREGVAMSRTVAVVKERISALVADKAIKTETEITQSGPLVYSHLSCSHTQ